MLQFKLILPLNPNYAIDIILHIVHSQHTYPGPINKLLNIGQLGHELASLPQLNYPIIIIISRIRWPKTRPSNEPHIIIINASDRISSTD